MDFNCKLGSKYIKGDPHNMSYNGTLLESILKRQNFHVQNGSEKCYGVITRQRCTIDRMENSVIREISRNVILRALLAQYSCNIHAIFMQY